MENRSPSDSFYEEPDKNPEDDDDEEEDEQKEKKPSLFRSLILGQEKDKEEPKDEEEPKKSVLEEDEPTEDILSHAQTDELSDAPELEDHVVPPTEVTPEIPQSIDSLDQLEPAQPESAELPDQPGEEETASVDSAEPWRWHSTMSPEDTPASPEEPDDEENEPDSTQPTAPRATPHVAPPTPPLPGGNVAPHTPNAPTPPRAPNATPPGGGGPNIPPSPGVNPNTAPGSGAGSPNTLNPAAPNINITNIENRPSWAPAIVGSVIVDQLSRGRDRRLRRELEHHAQKNKEDQEETERQLSEQTQHLRRQAREQQRLEYQMHEQHRSVRPEIVSTPPEAMAEKKPERVEKTPLIGQMIVERQEVKPEKAQKLPTPEITTPNVTRLQSQEVLKPKLDKSSELIFKQAETAAEQGIALENQYERRHEVKDVATSLAGGVQGDEQPLHHEVYEGDASRPHVHPGKLGSHVHADLPYAERQKAENAHKQAIRAGIITAGLILVALAIWALTAS